MNDKELNDIFSVEAVNFMRKSIVESYGNEVYFGINFNAFGILDHIEVMARGNKARTLCVPNGNDYIKIEDLR